MTPAERRAALVEKVARAMCSDGEPCGCTTACEISTHYAILALTVALEEAAKVCDPKGDCSEMDEYGKHYAAAIRALIPEGGK